jgi:VNT family MFS transporter (synaptic vesicle glycoprotein 2)
MMLGGWIWGSIADRNGRRPTLMLAMFINAIFGGLCSVVSTYEQFLALRIVSGIGFARARIG